MSGNVFLYLRSADEFYWWHGQDNEIISGREQELKFICRRKNLIVILPMDNFVCLPIDINAGNDTKLMATVPFALEDELLSPVEDLHFALATKSNTKRRVWTVGKQKMLEWLDILTSFELEPSALIPESALINPQSADYSLWVEDKRILFSQQFSTVKVSPEQLDLLFMNLSESDITITGFDFTHDFQLENLPTNINLILENSIEPLLTMVNNYTAKKSVNLLQADFAKPSKLIQNLKQWSLTTKLVASLALIYLASLFYLNYDLNQQITSINDQINSIHRQTFPKVKLIDAKIQMQQRLQSYQKLAKQNQPITSVLNFMGEVITQDSSTHLTKINYQHGSVEISLDVAKTASQLVQITKDAEKFKFNLLPAKPLAGDAHTILKFNLLAE